MNTRESQINIIHETGNITKIEPGITGNCNEVANIHLAIKVENNKTVFLQYTVWDKELVQHVFNHVSVGDYVYVRGRFSHDYKSTRPQPKLVAEEINVLLTKSLRNLGYVKDQTQNEVSNMREKLK